MIQENWEVQCLINETGLLEWTEERHLTVFLVLFLVLALKHIISCPESLWLQCFTALFLVCSPSTGNSVGPDKAWVRFHVDTSWRQLGF